MNRTARQTQILNQLKAQSVRTRKRMILDLVSKGTNISENGNLISELKAKTKIRIDPKGIPFKVVYQIPKYGIYRSKGVGKGSKIAEIGNSKRTPLDFYETNIRTDVDKFSKLFLEYWGEELYKASEVVSIQSS